RALGRIRIVIAMNVTSTDTINVQDIISTDTIDVQYIISADCVTSLPVPVSPAADNTTTAT
ncbi:4318_t:CDS:1, partial [Gigaspora rosea]